MGDLGRYVEAQKENVQRTLSDLGEAMRREEKSVIELAALATFLLNIYNGVENILKQSLKALNAEVPKSGTWHKNLLELSVSRQIIPEEVADKLREYLAFRHFFVHGYGFMLDETQLCKLANEIEATWSQFLSAVDAFIQSQGDK